MVRNYGMEKETFNINDRHLKRECVRPANTLRKKTFTVDDRFLKREHVLPADTFKKGDSLELLNDGMILEAEELIKKISKGTANGGARQRVFSKSVSVYSTDYGRLYIEVIYDSFTEKEIIIVLSRQEYESGNWKKDLDDEKLTEAYKYAVYVKAKDDESLPDWMRYGDGLDDTFNVNSKRELIDNLDALMITNADSDEIHYNVTRIASVSKEGEYNDIDLKSLPKKYEQLFESTKFHEGEDPVTLQDFYQLSTSAAKRVFIDAVKASYDVLINIDSFYKVTTTESLYELGESDDIEEEGTYVDFDVEYTIGRGKEEIHIEGFYNDYPSIVYIFNGREIKKTLLKCADEINFEDLIINVIKNKLFLKESAKEKNNFEEAYKKFAKTFNWYAEDQGLTLDTDIEANTFGDHFYIKGNVEIKERKIDNLNEKEVKLFYSLKNGLTSIYPIEFTDQIYLTQRYEIVNGKEKPFFVLKLGARKPFFDFKNTLEELVDPENWNDVASNLAIKMVECILKIIGLLKY